MNHCRLLGLVMVVFSIPVASVLGDEVHYFEKDGIVYREVRRTIQRPKYTTTMRESEQTSYRWQPVKETRQVSRSCCVPVTECCREAQWVGVGNACGEPHLEYRNVPRVRWEKRTEVVNVPVTSYRKVPETRTVQVPVTTRQMVAEEVVSRVAIRRVATPVAANAPPQGSTSPPQYTPPQGFTPSPQYTPPQGFSPPPQARPQIGGVVRLETDPPRYGYHATWRPIHTASHASNPHSP